MPIADSLIDNCNIPPGAITNLNVLPLGTGCPYLLVITGQFDDQYIAKRWLRKLPRFVHCTERIIRF